MHNELQGHDTRSSIIEDVNRRIVIDRRGKIVANVEGTKFSTDQLADLTRAVLKSTATKR